jgi:hypothetical protein
MLLMARVYAATHGHIIGRRDSGSGHDKTDAKDEGQKRPGQFSNSGTRVNVWLTIGIMNDHGIVRT